MKTDAPGAGKERATGQDLGCTLGRLFYLSLDHTAPDLHFSTGRRREGDWGLCSNRGGESEGLRRLVSAGRHGICRVDLVG